MLVICAKQELNKLIIRMHNFSMKVDLSNFFTDARSCSLVLIDSTWENVKDLQDHIQKLFYLNNISLLTDDECYLPPKESIKVLKSAQSLKAFHLDLDEEPELRNVDEVSRKRKNRSTETDIELVSSTPNLPKRSKCKNVTEDEATILEPSTFKRNTKKGKKSKQQHDNGLEAELEPELEAPEVSSINANGATPMEATTNTNDGNISSVKSTNHSKKHIIYKDDELGTEPADLTAVQTSGQAIKVAEFRCPLMELGNNSVRVFQLPRKSEPIKILEDIIIPAPVSQKSSETNEQMPVEEAGGSTAAEDATEMEQKLSTSVASLQQVGKDSTLLEDKSVAEAPTQLTEQSLLDSDSEDDVMVLDDTNLDDSDTDVQAVPVSCDESVDIIKNMLQNAAPLTNLPNAWETVIFKLAKSKGRKSKGSVPPPHTGYIAGTCSYVNRRTKAITINVIACSSGITHILRQYASNLDCSNDSSNLYVNFKELIDPKVIVSSVD